MENKKIFILNKNKIHKNKINNYIFNHIMLGLMHIKCYKLIKQYNIHNNQLLILTKLIHIKVKYMINM